MIERAGFDPAYVEHAVADDSTLTEVRDEHLDAVARFGAHGVPTIVFHPSEYAVYGPVVVPAPEGDDAIALWELVEGCSASRTCTSCGTRRRPKTSCTSASSSAPTWSTTDWNTVENPAP